jgi:hypothetical protein
MRILTTLFLLLPASVCYAQAQAPAPVETGRAREAQLQVEQIKAGNAYREMQSAVQVTREAEQEFSRVDAVHKELAKRSADAKLQADAAKKKYDAAKAREQQAAKAYENALNAVGGEPSPAKK